MQKAAIINYGQLIISQSLHKVLRFLIMIVVIRNSGLETWGQIVVLMTWIAYGNTVVDWGQSVFASVHKINNHEVEYDLQALHFWKHSIFSAVTVLSSLLVYKITNEIIWLYLTTYCSIFILKSLQPEWMYYRKQKPGTINTLLTLRSLFQLVLILIFDNKFSVLMFVISEIVSEILLIILSLKYWPLNRKFAFRIMDKSIIKELILKSTPFFLIGLAAFVHTNADIFILTWLTNDMALVGSYATSYRIVMFYYMIGGAFSVIFRTKAAKLIQSDLIDAYQNSLRINLKALFVLALFYVVLAASIIKPLMMLLFNLKEVNSHVIEIMSLYVLFSFASIILGESLVAQGKSKKMLFIITIGATANVVLNFIMIPFWGGNGSALSTVIAELVILLLLAYNHQLRAIFRVNAKMLLIAFLVFTTTSSLIVFQLPILVELCIGFGAIMLLLLFGWIKKSEINQLVG